MKIQQMTMSRLFSLLAALVLLSPISALAHDEDFVKAGRAGVAKAQSESQQSVREMVKVKRDAAKAALTEFQTAREEQKLVRLRTYGLRLTEHRLDAISKQESRVTNGKCQEVDPAVQTAITTGLADAQTNLEAQKTALTAATTVDEAKTIVQNVIQQNRVFIRLLPAVNGACISQRLIEFIDGRLTEKVDAIEATGIDTASIEAKMAEAKTDAQAAYEIYLEVLQNPGAESNKTKMSEAKELLQQVRQALGDIKSDIGNVMGEYRQKTGTTDDSDSESN